MVTSYGKIYYLIRGGNIYDRTKEQYNWILDLAKSDPKFKNYLNDAIYTCCMTFW